MHERMHECMNKRMNELICCTMVCVDILHGSRRLHTLHKATQAPYVTMLRTSAGMLCKQCISHARLTCHVCAVCNGLYGAVLSCNAEYVT